MTSLTYLQDTYQFQDTSRFISLVEDEYGTAVVLESTIFYPQGGGQPSDTGSISNQGGVFEVEHVRLQPDGRVFHYGTFKRGSFEPGSEVNLSIDAKKRQLHAKLHSAGHLIDCAVQELGLDLIPGKGYHFADGPYVEYEGIVEDAETVKAQLEITLQKLISENRPIEIEELTREEAVARQIDAPPGKSVRTVGFQGFPPCGCGGTHVRSSAEIGTISVRKLKSKKGNTRISYSVS